MSVLLERSMGEMNEMTKPVYPLFQKGAKPKDPPNRQDGNDASTEVLAERTTSNAVPKLLDLKAKRTKLPTSSSKANGQSVSKDNDDQGCKELLEVDPNDGRRKRRKTAATDGKPADLGAGERVNLDQCRKSEQVKQAQAQNIAQISNTSGDSTSSRCVSDIMEPKESENEIASTIKNPVIDLDEAPGPVLEGETGQKLPPQDSASNSNNTIPSELKPRKVLKFNPKTGTIGSPPAKKSIPVVEIPSKKTSTKGAKKGKSKIVTIRYGPGERLSSIVGIRIDEILRTSKAPVAPVKAKMDTSTAAQSAQSNPPQPKSVHPLFLGTSALKKTVQKTLGQSNDIVDLTSKDADRPRTVSRASQDGISLITGRAKPVCGKQSLPSNPAAFAGFSAFGSAAKLTKFPGAIEPAWPWKGMIHVRGDGPQKQDYQIFPTLLALQSKRKKGKYQAIEVLLAENVIETLASDLSIPAVVKSLQEIDPNDYPPQPISLRVPTKHNESGIKIQNRIQKELHARIQSSKTAVESSSEDEIRPASKTRDRIHAALSKTYESINTSLSAFDKGQCETQSWVHKYAPKCADEVLQAGREAFILKEWLQTLTVKSVEAGLGDRSRASSVARRGPIAAKRKRKSKKLDGFIISSDEEDMDEISEPEEGTPSGSQGPRTVIKTSVPKSNKDNSRLANAVVMSGPHGCGKTAAVYAVAKELGFEVFEINPSSRRSGKDIMDRVGDMTRNHLVQHSTTATQVNGAENDNHSIDQALANDIESGRQGTMISFFKPKPSAAAKSNPTVVSPAKKPEEAKEAGKTTTPAELKAKPKSQKQSLILIEEADIIFKDDAQFWPTVLNLIITSKRPVILTCNDESALPKDVIPWHAIIRMTPAPVDLAVDYMLVVAACEGHAVKREAVKTLYESRHFDLRASLTELNFWCQFAVGDVKRGLGWYYCRWPKGNDIDENGDKIRVVSEDAYATGIGLLSQDFLESHIHHLDVEEEVLHEAWDEWHVDLGDWNKSIDLESWAEKMQIMSSSKQEKHAALTMYEEFADSMSCADLCSRGTFCSDKQVALDLSFPALSAKAKEDYTLARELLEAPILVDFDNTSKNMSLWLKSRSRKYLQVEQHVQNGFEVPTELDRLSERDIIRLINQQVTKPEECLTRFNFSQAFDPIAESEKKFVWSPEQLEASAFDRTMALIVEDLAPYVRSIVAYDARLQHDRAKLSNLLSEGGQRSKRMRTTRAAMSALEGGARSTTRRDKYFGSKLNPQLVLKTGMQCWTDAAFAIIAKEEIEYDAAGSRRSSKASLEGSKDESERDELAESSALTART